MGFGNTNAAVGGTSLNFKVVGGTTEPANPKENMIWVNTPNKITGWHFAAIQPETIAEGEVWFIISTSSNVAFNALKKNTVMVYPNFVKQLVSGELKDVAAKTYKNGAWVDWWNGELYSPGNEWVDITGGWVGTAIQSFSGTSTPEKIPTITRNNGNIEVTNIGGSGVFHTANKIDLTDYDTITFYGNFYRGGSSNYNLTFGCWSELSVYFSKNLAASSTPSGTNTKVTLDVSNVSGEYYIGIGLVDSSTATINSVVMS